MFRGMSWQPVSFGEPGSVLRLRELTWAPPTEGRILVRVLASGLSLPDLLATRGVYAPVPAVPLGIGLEAVGEVVATPERSRFTVGQRVMGMTSLFATGHGGHAEYAYLLADETRPVPENLGDAQAAGFVIGFRTAHTALVDRCAIKPGETLAVVGAAGNSGMAAVQLGKALGATVIAVAGNADKLAYCQAIGADHGVNHTTGNVADEIMELTAGHGADVIFDPVGGEVAEQAVKAVAQFGRVAVIGFASGSVLRLDAFDMLNREYSAVGMLSLGDSWNSIPHRRDAAYDQLIDLVESAILQVPAPLTMPFAKLPEAVARLGTSPVGKMAVESAESY